MSDDLKVSKGPGFPVVARPGVGRLPFKGVNEQEAARFFIWRRQGPRRGWGLGWTGVRIRGFGLRFDVEQAARHLFKQ
jgi:hypothetical protein